MENREVKAQEAGVLEMCYCGRPDRKNWVHYNSHGYECAPVDLHVQSARAAWGVPPHKANPDHNGYCQTMFSGVKCDLDVSNDIHKIAEGTSDPVKVMEISKLPAVWIEHLAEDKVSYEFQNVPNDQAMRILEDILPKALELYLRKSKDYGGNVMDRFGLGQKAAIPDMARKFGKLIDAIWLDKPLNFEQPDEILMDLLGHILIILDQRATGK